MTKDNIEHAYIQQVEKTEEQLEDERAAAEDRAELPDFAAMSAQQVKKHNHIFQYIHTV